MSTTKFWSVKGWQYTQVDDLKYKNVKVLKRRLVVLGRDLTYQAAKALCKQYKAIQASIFPNLADSLMKVIKLS